MRVALRGLSKYYDGAHRALENIDLDIDTRESVALLGPSGCGKSTLIRILAGLETATAGDVTLDGRAAKGPTSEVTLVFQEPRLMPWLTVEDNVRLALVDQTPAQQEPRIRDALKAVGLETFAKALPRQLSGGMAQRAAVARALVRRPSVLLLDEPFSALDSFTRRRLQDHLTELWRSAKFTLLLVTHDIEEAIVVADRIVVLAGPPGRIAEDIRVDLPRPRERSSTQLQSLRQHLEDVISASHRRETADALDAAGAPHFSS